MYFGVCEVGVCVVGCVVDCWVYCDGDGVVMGVGMRCVVILVFVLVGCIMVGLNYVLFEMVVVNWFVV